MTGRPETLWPLFGALEQLDGVGAKTAVALQNAGWEKPRDLVFSPPVGAVDRRPRDTLQGCASGETATVSVQVLSHSAPRGPSQPRRVRVRDSQIEFDLVFFRAKADWLLKILPVGAARIVSGKVEWFDGRLQIAHPDYVLAPDAAHELPNIEPIYALTAGIAQKTMRRIVASALALAPELDEWIDPELKRRNGWRDWRDSLSLAHAPNQAGAPGADDPIRMRLAYDELFAHQLTLALARARGRRQTGRSTCGSGQLRDAVRADLPFSLTSAQDRAVAEIADDMAQSHRMMRLLQGDVGAGKTLVALLALLIAVEAGGQGALMAPTEILARQHLAGIAPLARAAGVSIDILTGRDKGAARLEKLNALRDGQTDILIGTHALFQSDVQFRDLRLAVIDEQHRFGVSQRMELGAKGGATDVLVMTATPIPRSLALAQYGDMDLSVLDEKPPGRQPITTALVNMARLDEVVEHLRGAITSGKQAYWVCPLVEESEQSDRTAAQERFKHLRAALGDDRVGLIHGQMAAADKDAAMARFVAGETSVLVATTVIEVGVDVPNSSIMVIERAEGFGLAQLHQLRGRVGRGQAASTCLLMYQAPLGDTARRRLETLRETEDGFRIAEEDLSIRGAGDMIGTAQSGLPRFRIADLDRHGALLATAQRDARHLLDSDPDLISPRGKAARTALWLMEQDRAIRMIEVG